jgi:hypothetical protein
MDTLAARTVRGNRMRAADTRRMDRIVLRVTDLPAFMEALKKSGILTDRTGKLCRITDIRLT